MAELAQHSINGTYQWRNLAQPPSRNLAQPPSKKTNGMQNRNRAEQTSGSFTRGGNGIALQLQITLNGYYSIFRSQIFRTSQRLHFNKNFLLAVISAFHVSFGFAATSNRDFDASLACWCFRKSPDNKFLGKWIKFRT